MEFKDLCETHGVGRIEHVRCGFCYDQLKRQMDLLEKEITQLRWDRDSLTALVIELNGNRITR